MRVLIVDDDMPTVDVIQSSLHWENLGVDDVFTAYDFAEAQKRIRQYTPDIVLCDIEMPRGSGLDLLRWLREEDYHCEFVFLTCHASFDYAQMAIQYGAADYITKPFNIETMETTLRRVTTRLLYRQQQPSGDSWQDERQLAQASFLRNLLFEGSLLEAAQLQQRFTALGLAQRVEGPAFLVLVAVPQSRIPDGWKPDQFAYALRNLAAELWGGLDQTRAFSYFKQDTHYCLAWFVEETQEQVTKGCEHLCQACQTILESEATCYLSAFSPFWKLSLRRENLEHHDQLNVAHRCEILYESELSTPGEIPAYSLDMDRLEQLLRQGNVAGTANYVSNALQTLAAKKQVTPEVLHHVYQDILQLIFTVLQREGVQAHELFQDSVATNLSRNAERSLLDMTKWLTFSVNRTVNFLWENRQTQGVAGRIEQYIRDHYSERIGYAEIAAAVFLTPDYANRLFKAQNNISIKDYLTQYRIDQAKRLLLDPQSNVSDVAAQIGMDNFSYFSTLFKKHTGLSPSEFRKQFMGANNS